MLAGILIASYRWKFQVRYHLVAQEHALAIWDGKNPKSFKILVDAMSPKDITFDDTAVPNLLPND
jgi:hypothetical protein